MKKGQGLSLNVIIIAALVLIVLIVLWAIFTGRMGVFSTGMRGTQKCSEACTALGKIQIKTADACKDRTSTGYIGEYSDAAGKKDIPCCCEVEGTTPP